MPTSLDILPPDLAVPTCCAPSPHEADPSHGTKFHFSLNVSDLERSIAFYRVLFAVEPAKHHRDYAKFELTQPPLVFSLVPNPPSTGGALSHFGFPVATAAEVEEVGRRLAAAGLEVSCQNNTFCGYARQEKIWIADPDHNYWEIYVVYEDVDPESVRSGFEGTAPKTDSATPTAPEALLTLGGLATPPAAFSTGAAIWEHRVLDPIPARIPHPDGSLDIVRLEGTFNADFTRDERARFLENVFNVLKPGGEVQVHGLVADQPLKGGLPALPGVAALVRRIPIESEPMGELSEAGFILLEVTKLPQSPAFRTPEAEMREIKLSGRKPASVPPHETPRFVLYKGPFAQTVDDEGNVYHRGRRTPVSARAWEELGRSTAAGEFLFLTVPEAGSCSAVRSCAGTAS